MHQNVKMVPSINTYSIENKNHEQVMSLTPELRNLVCFQ